MGQLIRSGPDGGHRLESAGRTTESFLVLEGARLMGRKGKERSRPQGRGWLLKGHTSHVKELGLYFESLGATKRL